MLGKVNHTTINLDSTQSGPRNISVIGGMLIDNDLRRQIRNWTRSHEDPDENAHFGGASESHDYLSL